MASGANPLMGFDSLRRAGMAGTCSSPVQKMTDGTRRYVHLSGAEGGVWLSETYQILDGDYLGSSQHVRADTAPEGDASWTPRSQLTPPATDRTDIMDGVASAGGRGEWPQDGSTSHRDHVAETPGA